MKSLSMYRYTPLLLAISLFTLSGCAQINPKIANEQPVSTAINNNASYGQVDEALTNLERAKALIAQNENPDQYSQITGKIEQIRTLLGSSAATINTIQAEKFEEQAEKVRRSLNNEDLAQALDDIKALQDILTSSNLDPEKAPTDISAQEFDEVRRQIQKLQKGQNSITVFGLEIPFPLALAKGSGLIGFIALVTAVAALLRVQKQRDKVYTLQNEINKLKKKNPKNNENENDIDGGLRPAIRDQDNLKEELSRAQKRLDISTSGFSPPSPIREVASITPPIEPAKPIKSQSLSKSGLIAALNNGDRQQLREAVSSELNITSESENAIITGRSTNTELEVVSGGGSYLLVMLLRQPLLFPTEKTLKGFTAAQRSKGLFDYEQQTIGQPQLLEPALLEGSGDSWTVKQIGRIAIP